MHRKYLRFSFQSKVYKFVTRPFSSERIQQVHAVLSPLRHKGLRISAYLDDYLICTQSREHMEQYTEMLMSYLTNLGLIINYAKSWLIPSQEKKYLRL